VMSRPRKLLTPPPVPRPFFSCRRSARSARHHFVVDELLDAVAGRLAPLRVHLVRLFAKSHRCRHSSVGVCAAPGQEGLDPGGRVAEGAAAALDEGRGTSFRTTPEITLEGPELYPNAGVSS